MSVPLTHIPSVPQVLSVYLLPETLVGGQILKGFLTLA